MKKWEPYAAEIAFAFREQKKKTKKIISGFAWILEQVKVDLDLLRRAPITELKSENLARKENLVEEWYLSGQDITYDVFINSGDAYAMFAKWAVRSGKEVTDRIFRHAMTDLVNRDLVKRDRNNSERGYVFSPPQQASASVTRRKLGGV